jgi:hypothetical protein
MSVLGEELKLMAFEAPHMGIPDGIPDGSAFSAREMDQDGRFVEVFLDVRGGKVVRAGFLTDIAVEGVLCASLWCGAASGACVEAAVAVSAHDLLVRFPAGYPPPLAAARACVRAGRAALAKAGQDSPWPGARD